MSSCCFAENRGKPGLREGTWLARGHRAWRQQTQCPWPVGCNGTCIWGGKRCGGLSKQSSPPRCQLCTEWALYRWCERRVGRTLFYRGGDKSREGSPLAQDRSYPKNLSLAPRKWVGPSLAVMWTEEDRNLQRERKDWNRCSKKGQDRGWKDSWGFRVAGAFPRPS